MRSHGEEAYAQLFQFKTSVPYSQQEELRDYFYKIAHNLTEARRYFDLLQQLDRIDHDDDAQGLYWTFFGMLLQCLALSMRRLTDRSRRSVQKFIESFGEDAGKQTEKDRIKSIREGYKNYLNNAIAHQSEKSFAESIRLPDTPVIKSNIEYLESIYQKYALLFCTKSAGVYGEKPKYLEQLRSMFGESK